MRILKAEHLGMCFGVRDAIALAHKAAQAGPLTILGDLVHNEAVLEGLRKRGVRLAGSLEEADTRDLMVTAHGASQAALATALARGFRVTEATCPLVRSAHDALTTLVRTGYHPVIVGKRDHVEVRGMTEDLTAYDVVLTSAEVFAVEPRARFGVVAQTTQPLERVEYLAGLLRWRFPEAEVRLIDTVCRPTKQRQRAAIEMAAQSDVVIVVGGHNSNNTRELVRTCAQHCAQVYHIESVADLDPAWIARAATVGLTAGTSTPDGIVEEVERRLEQLGAEKEWSDKESAGHANALVAGTL